MCRGGPGTGESGVVLHAQYVHTIELTVMVVEATALEVPMKPVGHRVEYLRGRAEAKGEHGVNKDLISPSDCLERSVLRVDWYEAVG